MKVSDSPADTSTRPRLALTLGDPRGIGPEIVDKALRDPDVRAAADFVVIGPEGAGHFPDGATEFVGIGAWKPGDGAAAAGQLAGEAVRAAVEMALAGQVDAVVTAPLDKAAFHAGGWRYPGHTEMLQHLCGAPAVGMMMAAETTAHAASLRVVLATTHLALRDVPRHLSSDLFVEQGRLTVAALREWWAIPAPRIGFCAVNPHAGDGGLFGDEEAALLRPAIERLRHEGIDASGPVPADTVFLRALRGEWDAVIAPYHDVGMAAFKTAAFGRGVNVTLGLPFPRTSPDHGTALDIAGQNVADPSSMLEAVRLAIRLAARFDTRRRRD
jgi:4-hydroxythreonine-4-phosphate dehydrogenase